MGNQLSKIDRAKAEATARDGRDIQQRIDETDSHQNQPKEKPVQRA
jgi:hypothetical protein